MNEFVGFPKIARLNREITVCEKIDGTNAQVFIPEDGGAILAGSRTRWITPEQDNYGFAAWVRDNAAELRKLGPGRFFGEWWGAGIQRRYNQTQKIFSLFREPLVLPGCCCVVPVLYRGIFDEEAIRGCIVSLDSHGSVAAPGFYPAEGIVVYHTAANISFKVTLEKDDEHKGPQ